MVVTPSQIALNRISGYRSVRLTLEIGNGVRLNLLRVPVSNLKTKGLPFLFESGGGKSMRSLSWL